MSIFPAAYSLYSVKVWHDFKVTVTIDKGENVRAGFSRYVFHTGSARYLRRLLRERYGLTPPTALYYGLN